MTSPLLTLQLPDGTEVAAGAEEVIGRSTVATIRIADPRVSTIHAEISWRDAGPMLLARGGRLLVHGRPVPELLLEPGIRVELAPGVPLTVLAVRGASQPVPATAGREALVWELGPAEVAVKRAHDGQPLIRLTGMSARLVRHLLHHPDARAWDEVASALWPEDGALRARGRTGAADDWTETDERRLRNRWDQVLHVLRRQLAAVRGGTVLESSGGTVALRLGSRDQISEPSARRESP